MSLFQRYQSRRKLSLRSRVRVERLESRMLLAVTAELPSTPALYNPDNGTFFLRNENAGGVADTAFDFGPAGQGWIPITGDWNNDGVDSIGLYEPSNSVFFLQNENTSGVADMTVGFGAAGNGGVPVTGDWDGDGIDTVGLYDPDTGFWFLRDELAAGIADEVFGYGPGGLDWLPIVGDWNDDGVDTVGVYDPVNGVFFMRDENSAGFATTTVQFGPGGDGLSPLAGDWDGNGTDTFALHSQTGSTFNLRNVDLPGPADMTFGFGPAGSDFVPLAGHWINDPFDTQGGLYATPGEPDEDVPTRFTLVAEHADFNNELGLFIVDDSSGRVGVLSPGDPGYAAAAISRRQVIFTQDDEVGSDTTLNLPGDSFFALYLIQDGTSEAFLAFNPTNQIGLHPLAFFSLVAANPDDFDHVKNLAPIVFAWEDLTGGGDQDFNDAIVLFQFGRPFFVPDTQAPVVTIFSPAPGSTETDTMVTVTGRVTDNREVASAEAQVDAGAFFPLTLDAAGNFSFDTTLAEGPHTVRIRARDDEGNETVAETTFTVDVTAPPVNTAPIAVNDSFTVDEDGTIDEPPPGVLGNDTDADGDPLTAVLVTDVASGTLVLDADGSFTYTPDADFSGTDTFTYQAFDGTALSNVATVTIIVSPVGDAPVAANDAFATDEDTPLIVAPPGVLANDTDPDGDPLTAVLVTGVSDGTLVFNADGSFTYTPDADFSGTDSFTYQADDGTDLSNIATVTITVTAVADAPVAVDDAFATDEDTPLIVPPPGVLENDTDAEDDPLTAVLVTGVSDGTLVFNADGSFTYTPDFNFSGTDTFTYQADDGTDLSNVATVTITVNAVNDAPIANDDTFTATADTTLTVVAPGVLLNDIDPDLDPLTAVLVTDVANGTLTLNADGSFDYTPNAGFTGTDTFTYVANDGTADSNVATVTITVNAPPVAVDDEFFVDEDAILDEPALTGVLANDTDAEFDPLTAELVTDVTNGTLELSADGSFTYTPDDDFFGTDFFTYVANDGTSDSNVGTVIINVNAVNDAPVGVADEFSIVMDTTLTTSAGVDGVLENDIDVDLDALTAIQMSDTVNGTLTFFSDGSFTYTPNQGFTGTDTFTYVASDGTATSGTTTVTITVTAT